MSYGHGRVYQRGTRWWLQFSVKGEDNREPAIVVTRDGQVRAARNQQEAEKALAARRKEIDGGRFVGRSAERITVKEICADYVTHATAKGLRSADKLESTLQAVLTAFGSRPAMTLTTAMLERQAKEWRDEGKAAATVCRRYEALRGAFNYAANQKPPRFPKHEIPHFEFPKVQNARQGFITKADLHAILQHVEDPNVRDFLEWFWWTGMRPNEIRQLNWTMLDRDNPELWTLDLDPKAAKIGKGRSVAVVGPLRAIIERRLTRRRFDSRLIFHRTSRGKAGQPVKDYRLAWAAACKAAGLKPGRKAEGGVTPYDLRRCAVRNLIRAGVHETVAMKISGHKTRSTFDRYNIASVDDIRDAMTKTAACVEALPSEREQGQKRDKDGRAGA